MTTGNSPRDPRPRVILPQGVLRSMVLETYVRDQGASTFGVHHNFLGIRFGSNDASKFANQGLEKVPISGRIPKDSSPKNCKISISDIRRAVDFHRGCWLLCLNVVSASWEGYKQ